MMVWCFVLVISSHHINMCNLNQAKSRDITKKCEKQKSAVLTGSVSTRNVYICEIFSCYSGYQSVFFLDLCTFSQPNKCVGLKRTTILHILHSTPLCQHMVPCTIHRTATGAGNATSHSVPRPFCTKAGSWQEMASIPTTTSASRARWTPTGYPALQEAMVCSQSATKEGQDNNLLVAMK